MYQQDKVSESQVKSGKSGALPLESSSDKAQVTSVNQRPAGTDNLAPDNQRLAGTGHR